MWISCMKSMEIYHLLKDKRDCLVMLIMYHWLFDRLKESDYWTEYVQLCATNRNIELNNG